MQNNRNETLKACEEKVEKTDNKVNRYIKMYDSINLNSTYIVCLIRLMRQDEKLLKFQIE